MVPLKRRIKLNIIKPVLLGGNIMVPMKKRIKQIIKLVLLGGNTMVPMNEKDKIKYSKTCITRREYNGSYE